MGQAAQINLAPLETAAVLTVGANGLPMDVVGHISLSVGVCGTEVKQTFPLC